MRKIHKIAKKLTIFSGLVLAFSWQAQGIDRIWSNTLGGDFTNSANWSAGFVPGVTDVAVFSANASYEVTFSTTVTNANAYFNASGGTINLNIGSGNLYYATSLLKVPNDNTVGDASVDLTSGSLSAAKIYVGDPLAFNAHRLTVRNPGTTLTTRGDDIIVGSNGSGNLLSVTNGASVACGRTVYVGYMAASSNNAIVVSGTGTRLMANTTVMIGRYNVNNRLLVEDGAEVACTNGTLSVGDLAGANYNSVIVRSGSVLTNGGANISYVGNGGSYNAMIVSNAAFWSSGNLNVGQSGSFNRLDILDGGTVAPRPHLFVGSGATSDGNSVLISGSNSLLAAGTYEINVGNSGHYNTFTVTNGATAMGYRGIVIGLLAGSSYNQLIVSGTNSLLTALGRNGHTSGPYALGVGGAGTDNLFRMENGAIYAWTNNTNMKVSIGSLSGADRNSAYIGSGCVASNCGPVYVGEGGNGNALIVSNATVHTLGTTFVGYTGSGNSMTLCGGARYTFPGHLFLGNGASASNNALTVTGSGTILTNQNYDLDVGNSGSANRMRVADNAEVRIARAVYVGHTAGASNNVLEIEGGTFRSLQSVAGTTTMTVSNACMLAVYGSNSLVQAKALKIVDRSRLDIRIGKEGFTPIAVSGTVTFDDTTKLAVDAFSLAKAGGGTVTLMTYGAKSGTIAAQNITLVPASATLNQADGKSITIHVPSLRGTIISIQ